MMTLDEEIAAILADHKPVDLGGGLQLKPLSMDDFAANGPDLAQIAKALYAGIGLLPTTDAVDAEALLDQAVALLTPALPAVQRMLGRCLSKPLAELPLALAPLLLRKFVERNFSNLHLRLWVGPLSDLAALVKATRTPTTSATPGSSSSTTDTTPAGSAATPAGSSSSGSGAASAANSADKPT